jgi:hypothetical protein
MGFDFELVEALKRIGQIESNEAEGRKERRVLSWLVTQWEDWFLHRDVENFEDQSTYTISSGSLLWGQIICLYSTLSDPNFTQNANHIAPELEGGTVVQHRYTYRSAARNGRWKVRAFYERERLDPLSSALLADPDAPER